MNSTPRSDRNLTFAILALAMLATGWAFPRPASAAGSGLDVEIPYEIKALKTSLTAPYFLDKDGGDVIVSDQAGGVYKVTMAGKATVVGARDKLKNPAGVAVAPAGFGSHGGEYFVLNANDAKGACEVDTIDKSGSVSSFAKLPAEAKGCRGIAFGASGTPYAGKLYAATTGNATIYGVDPSGKVLAFGVYNKPVAFELTTISFASSDDPKAPNMMLVGMRPNLGGASKVGRIGIVGPDGKLKDDVYLVGFIRPSGFAYSPANWGTYDHVFFIVDTGKFASENDNMRDGSVARLEKGIARPFASGLMDPTDMKFVGSKMVITDPAERGKGQGAIVVISSMM
jgi:hypothetical protein